MISIRQRLLIGLLAGLSGVLGLAGYATYRQARAEINALFDYQLRQTALAMRQQNLLTLALSGEARDEESDVVVQVWDRQRGLLYVSRKPWELPFATEPGFADLLWRDELWRLFTLPAGARIVQVAQPVRVRRRMSADIALRNLAPFLLLLPVMGLVVWFGVGAGLRPLSRLAADLRQRRPVELAPVAVERLPAELTPLASALNDLLVRLTQTLDAQRQFIADAAHELRTPLTAVRLQAEIAQRAMTDVERAGTLATLRAGLTRASHLVEQLLIMARLDAAPVAERLESVNLLEMAKQMVVEYAAIADDRCIDLGLLPGDAVTVAGEVGEWRTLLGNLVDNALRYTPAGGRVDVQVRQVGAETVLSVTDTGPGIPPEERERVFDRFVRLDATRDRDTGGAGLGLAIAADIARAHGGTLAAGEAGDGWCRFELRIPRG